ncbi:ABC transporter permease [bacterium]|nr:ABC transporter permease [bacterium]
MASGRIDALDAKILEQIRYVGASVRLVVRALLVFFKRPFEFDLILEQMHSLGVKSLTIVSLTSFFTGMVLCLQLGFSLTRFGAKGYVGRIIALSFTRELGPMLVSIIVSGRVAAGVTAELGSMKVSDQIDAMRVMGASPIKKLVMPRVVALMITLPMLVLLGDCLGILGGLVMGVTELDLKAGFYFSSSLDILSLKDVMSGLGKCVFFGLIITGIGCYQGLTTLGGTRGVGISTTQAVVLSSIMLLVSDFFLTKAFMLI